MAKKVYVGNLPWSVDNKKLTEIFADFGETTEVTVITDKFSGRSKGFGFVTFANDEDADKAIAEVNEKEVDGRQIKVTEAKPMDPDRKPQRRSGGFGSGGGFGGRRRF